MRTFLRAAAMAALVLHVACGGGGGESNPPPPPPNARAPNIVLILTDDQDMASLSHMVQLKSLVNDQGMRLDQHYVSLSLCCPSRISALRGQYAHNTGIYTNGLPDGGFQTFYAKGLEQSTYATWLQAAGYRTAMFGKYLNGYPETADAPTYVPPGWTEWYVSAGGESSRGFNYTLNENGVLVNYGSTETDYMTDVLSNKAADFIRRSVASNPNQPFLAYIGTHAPHSPAEPAPRHLDRFLGIQAPRGPAFNEADTSDKPSWVQELPLLDQAAIDDIDRRYRRRMESLLAVDDLIKNVVDTLSATGQLANTYIFFTSDNGYHLGQHRMEAGKMTAFEEDIRVPMFVRGPGIAAGSSTRLLTANVDHAATFAEIAGVAAPDFVDGRSLLPVLHGQTPSPWRQVLLLEHKKDEPDEEGVRRGTREPPDPFDRWGVTVGTGVTPFSGLRTADGYTYIEYIDGEFELYDHAADPNQLNNSYTTAPADLKARLNTRLTSLRTARGAELRNAEANAQ
jgi:N-acetylglucosamine-6-sulfatase